MMADATTDVLLKNDKSLCGMRWELKAKAYKRILQLLERIGAEG